ncbi:MAG TPA: alcohol dehydrogenase catalytic domain-containing protein [Geminicoccus sp.]|uniref:zinc-dependent alcohol dehydrogenase n=1 Tax=Geminicoccus sp. TaxID=2024832 RepID=UPI002CA3D45F|nr:alcohol dehydrogenase catalytic domain-containing protein [Geminicoccus sp.]HWL71455.1 alcohol dehydrogenase catalytic domain-containing protein [Geminicoccus sp.]
MLALKKTEAAFGLHLQDVAPPAEPGPGEVTVEVRAVGICGSDIHAYEWTAGYEFMVPHLPLTLGHEFAGRVARLGPDVTNLAEGDLVTVWPTVGCGTCRACRSGRRQDCQERRIIGLHQDGGYAREVTVPAASCIRLPDGLDLHLAAMAEPLCVGQNAVDVAAIEPGDAVLVLGPGPIGLGIAWLARQQGADPVILAGYDDPLRLDCGRRMGLQHLVDLKQEKLADAVMRIAGRPVDRVIEATGAIRSIHDGLAVLRSSGILVVAGIHSEPLQIDLTRLVRDKKQLRTAHDTHAAAWPRVLDHLARHGDQLGQMISHRLPLSAALEGFELARRKEAIKVILEP